MSTKTLFFLLVTLGVVFEIGADVILKRWVTEERHIWLLVGLLVYFIGTIFWAFSLRYETLSKAIAIFTLVNLLVGVCIGVIFFNESLTWWNKVGIILGIVSILLLEV